METPTLSKTILDLTEGRLLGLHTMLPGKVVKVDVLSGKCDVQPLLMRLGSDGVAKLLPVITNCAIANYRSGKAAVYLPLNVGDGVEIRFCERSLDIWLAKGGTVDPSDARKHNLSDAVAYPGMYPFTDPPLGADASKLTVVNDKSKMTLDPLGAVKIENENGFFEMTTSGTFNMKGSSDELLALVSDLVDLLTKVQTATMLGPQTFLPPFISQLSALKGKIDTLKG